jgi:hypothetical protein
MGYIYAVTGNREVGMSADQEEAFRDYLHWGMTSFLRGGRLRDQFRVLHGGAPGVDVRAGEIAWKWGFGVEVFPSNLPDRPDPWKGGYASVVWPPASPLERNRTMIERGEMLLAFPHTFHELQRSGTWHAIRYAQRIHKPTVIIFPDGMFQVRDGAPARVQRQSGRR